MLTQDPSFLPKTPNIYPKPQIFTENLKFYPSCSQSLIVTAANCVALYKAMSCPGELPVNHAIITPQGIMIKYKYTLRLSVQIKYIYIQHKLFFVIGWECPQRFITWLKITSIPLRV